MARGMKRSRPVNNLAVIAREDENTVPMISQLHAQRSSFRFKKKKNRHTLSSNVQQHKMTGETGQQAFVQQTRNEPSVLSDAWSTFFSSDLTASFEASPYVDCDIQKRSSISSTQVESNPMDQEAGNLIESLRSVRVSDDDLLTCWEFDRQFVETSPADLAFPILFPLTPCDNKYKSSKTRRKKRLIDMKV
uniref:Uncharacterized protein n=1 Tax=Corethron hystrix TaxID=216773 RepID=A0A7S1BR88_9STRA|mmetsp:Transcript_36748/g.85854  ORF Transcript_36748/g.85854 Transcript_36748/m.85854 type:complete len:191 (+) Transcript_36748:296-868(+)